MIHANALLTDPIPITYSDRAAPIRVLLIEIELHRDQIRILPVHGSFNAYRNGDKNHIANLSSWIAEF